MFNESLFTAIAAITKYFIFSLFAFSAVSTELIFFFFLVLVTQLRVCGLSLSAVLFELQRLKKKILQINQELGSINKSKIAQRLKIVEFLEKSLEIQKKLYLSDTSLLQRIKNSYIN